jgi:hypothetical protein
VHKIIIINATLFIAHPRAREWVAHISQVKTDVEPFVSLTPFVKSKCVLDEFACRQTVEVVGLVTSTRVDALSAQWGDGDVQ